MRRRDFAVLLAGAPLLAQTAPPLRTIDGGACVAGPADYGFMWLDSQLLCVQTGRYGAAIDVQRMRLAHFGALQNVLSYSQAVSQDQTVIFDLPPGRLSIVLKVGGREYRCVRAGSARLIEAGRFLQRAEILQLEFADEAGRSPGATGRLEIVAWPDRIAFLAELTPDLADAVLSVSVGNSTEPHADFSDVDSAVEIRTAAPVSRDNVRGWIRIDNPGRLSITNSTAKPQVARLLFANGAAGAVPILCDSDGAPNGLHVQLSQNSYAMLRMPPRSVWAGEFRMIPAVIDMSVDNVFPPLARMRVAYHSYGPNLASRTFAGVTADGKIAARIHVLDSRSGGRYCQGDFTEIASVPGEAGKPRIQVLLGAVVQDYPPVVMVDEDQTAALEITGGVGSLPVTFIELLDYKGQEILVTRDGKTSALNQLVQVTQDPSERTWSLTCIVPLGMSVRLELRKRR